MMDDRYVIGDSRRYKSAARPSIKGWCIDCKHAQVITNSADSGENSPVLSTDKFLCSGSIGYGSTVKGCDYCSSFEPKSREPEKPVLTLDHALQIFTNKMSDVNYDSNARAEFKYMADYLLELKMYKDLLSKIGKDESDENS